MRSTGKAKSVKQRLQNFRLTAAAAILGNLAHTGHLTRDMHAHHHIAELCEQYSLFILLKSLSTKYGLAVSPIAIHEESSRSACLALDLDLLADRYPFYSYDSFPRLAFENKELNSLAEQLLADELESVGLLYQQILAAPLAISEDGRAYIDLQSDRRSAGEFYTPSWVTDYAFQSWFNASSASLLKRLNSEKLSDWPIIMDPACGSGNFLLAAVRLFKQLQLPPKQILQLASHALRGTDIDGKALELAKITLVLALVPELKELSRVDSCSVDASVKDLNSAESFSFMVRDLLESFDKNLKVCDSLMNACTGMFEFYDLVVTNPPYLSFGAREQGRLDAQWQAFLKQRFPSSAEYKLRYTSMFQEIAIENSQSSPVAGSPKASGQALLLVPDAFLSGSYYGKLRNFILRSSKIISLTELPERTFPDATAGRWCLAHYAVAASCDDEKASVSVLEFKDSSISPRKFVMPFASFVSRDRQRFQLVFSNEDLEILELCRDLPWLGDELKGHTGIRSRLGQKAIIADCKLAENYRAGIISGAEVHEHKVLWNRHWLEINPEKLFAGGFDERVLAPPKLLVRQTGDRIIAAVDLAGLYHLNNVHSFVPLDGVQRGQSVYYYSCILNSSFYTHYYRIKTREFRKALAQIDIETVEHMPAPSLPNGFRREIQEMGKKLAEAGNEELPGLRKLANDVVFESFGVSKRLREHINAILLDSAQFR